MRYLVAVLVLVALAACASEKAAPWLTYPYCTSCHGDATRGHALAAAAPPFDVAGDSTTTARGVGAHAKHLADGPLRVAIGCDECHPVPTDPLHADGVVEIAFGPIASTLFDPVWNSTALTCSTYCHGGTTGGGTLKTPLWTKVDGTQAACGTCHGIPPPAPHSQSTSCGGCHPGYTRTTVDPTIHIDGIIQANGGSGGCTSCHGDSSAPATYQAAPPVDTAGNSATTAPGVGAHRQHVTDGPLRPAMACTECHPPVDPSIHPDGTLHVSFGPLASAAGSTPSWTASSVTCASVYCHGTTLGGGAGTATAPIWTRVDGTQVTCGSCHMLPPPASTGHPQNSTCGQCHPGYTSTTVNPATHIDGVVDLDPSSCGTSSSTCSCMSCHGDPARLGLPSASAPPFDTSGNSTTTALGVGAHRKHLEAGPLSIGIACTECHPVPATTAASGTHRNGTVDLVFGPLSNTTTVGSLASPGFVASWNATPRTCAAYCHGASLAGGSNRAPVWTTVDGTQAACGTCHGVPPPTPHVQRTDCGSCHPGSTSTTVDATTHIDGALETVALSCTTCHGDPTRVLVTGADPRAQAAPPNDSTGASATSLVTVGAHQTHLNRATGAIALPTACTECHVVPASNLHANGTVNVAFGAKSRIGGVSPTWTAGTATCAASYCHGATLKGGTGTSPVWTTVNGTYDACTSCHGMPPSTGQHGVDDHRAAGCGACHAGYSNTAANVAVHVDGVKQVGNEITSYSEATLQCTNTCHGNKGAW